MKSIFDYLFLPLDSLSSTWPQFLRNINSWGIEWRLSLAKILPTLATFTELFSSPPPELAGEEQFLKAFLHHIHRVSFWLEKCKPSAKFLSTSTPRKESSMGPAVTNTLLTWLNSFSHLLHSHGFSLVWILMLSKIWTCAKAFHSASTLTITVIMTSRTGKGLTY